MTAFETIIQNHARNVASDPSYNIWPLLFQELNQAFDRKQGTAKELEMIQVKYFATVISNGYGKAFDFKNGNKNFKELIKKYKQ